ALARVIETTVLRYRNHPALDSWQLENEALNNQFGECVDFDGNRLAAELELVKQLDPSRLVVMSLKNHHTFSTRGPRPDIYATSIYLIMHRHNRYARSWLPPWYQRLRSLHIRQVLRRPFFIHELQAEPWGPAGTQDLSRQEQDRSMNPARFRHAINYARRTGIEPVDLWGLEWWYYRRARFGDEAMWQAAKALFKN
ncbi:MAG TPA: glycoside hydrolase family 2 TIM barrel-domain containing protein, partial [Candidatus Saccharimonadales bacterium]|nr:glycoside hydrolase family 2 TIM barrel-domain containing protein [Candidatus Saccharimonadales bacterium]